MVYTLLTTSIREDILDKLNNWSGLDYIMLKKFIENAYPIINRIAGVIIVICSMMLLLIIALEVTYLSSPTVKNYTDTKILNGEGITSRPLELCLHDAIKAYREFMDSDREKTLLFIYLRIKIKVIIIYGICFALSTGYGEEIAQMMYNVASEVIDNLLHTLL